MQKRQSRSELQALSQFLQKKSDDEMCEIIDVLTHCGNLKRKLVDGDKPINSGLTFKLEQIVDSLGVVEIKGQTPSEQEWKAFADILTNTLKISKLSFLQKPIAKYGAEWVKSINNEETRQLLEVEDITNPLQYWTRLHNNERFGIDCSEGKASDDYKHFFEECWSDSQNNGVTLSHVLKSSYSGSSAGGKHMIPKKGRGGAWRNQMQMVGAFKEDYLKNYLRSMLVKGLIDEDCENLKVSWAFVRFHGPASSFCHELNKLIFGNTVDEKLGKSISFGTFGCGQLH